MLVARAGRAVTRALTVSLAALGLLTFTPGCPSPDYERLYHTEPIAPQLTESEVRGLDTLGATLLEGGVNFSVFSGHADRIDLLLFDDPDSSTPTRQFQMERFGDAWNLFVQGVGEGQHYGYVAWGPNWPEHPDWIPGTIHGFIADVDGQGHRFNPNKLLLDPYTRAVHRDHDWREGSLATGPMRHESTWSAAAKSVVTKSRYEWSDHEAEWRAARRERDPEENPFNEQIVYEVHPKGFTADPASGVEHPGTFRGFGEKAEYLADLGITAVELMPIMEKPLDGGYWGYNTLLFFAPEHTYAYDQRPGRVLDEVKWMVDQLHQHGIEVYLDVVHNHTGEGGLWRHKLELSDVDLDPRIAPVLGNYDEKEVVNLYNFRGLDNVSYYALREDDPGFYVNNTGVGNQTRTNYAPMRRLIIDNLRFWVEEVGIDGFRFDLAPIYGEKDRDYGRWADMDDNLIQEIADDPVMRENNIRIIAEPWSISMFSLGDFPASNEDPDFAWYEWNAHFKNTWRSFLNYDDRPLSQGYDGVDIGGGLTGSQSLFGWNRRPHHSVNYIVSHDGFTMYDLFTYEHKQNGCSPLNPACCEDPFTPFCDRDSGESYNRSRDWGDERMKRQMMRNAFAAIMLSQGTPMIYSGDEWMRTQLGNNNAYSPRADNPFNWLQWGNYRAQDERHRMHDYVRSLIRLRQDRLHAFAPDCYEERSPFAWKNRHNEDATADTWQGRHIAKHYWDETAGSEIFIIINMEGHEVEFSLPEGRAWTRLLDTQQWFDDDDFLEESAADPRRTHNVTIEDPVVVEGGAYVAMPRTFVLLEGAK